MAVWPIRFSAGARPGKRPHTPDLNGEDTKRKNDRQFSALLFTQIQLQIILFLLFWDVLWIINDLLAPPSLFFHEFQQNRGFYGQYQTIPISVGSLTITNIPKYTLKFRLSKVIYIYINYFYIFTENLILKILQRWRKCRREILMKKRIDLNVAYNNGADEYWSI